MHIKENFLTISTMFIPIFIGLVIPYSLLLNQTESWVILLGTFICLVFFALVVKYQIAFLYFVLFSLFGIMSTTIKPFDLMFVAMFLFMLFVKKGTLNHFKHLKLVHLSLFFFIVISFLSIISSSFIKEGFVYFIHTLFVIMIFYFIFLFGNEERKFKNILWGYIFSTIISSLLIVCEFFGIFTSFNTLFQGTRAKGLFLDPNDFSPYLLLAILFLLHQFMTRSLKNADTYGYLLLTLFLIGIQLASLSRAAMLNLGISLCFYFFFYLLNRGSVKHLVTYLTTILLSVITVFLYLRESIMKWLSIRFYASNGIIQSYDTDRFYYQLQGLKLGSSKLFGIGPGQFELLMDYATHNLYIRIIAENGWIAFFLFVQMIIILFIELWKNKKQSIWGIPIYLLLAGFIGLIVNSFFLDTLHWRYLWFYFGLCAVLLVNIKKTN